MCGVVGLRCERDRQDLGKLASKLLRMLEYRGYDSTGAIIQNSRGDLVLKKDVGSPTVVTEKLEISKLAGKIFCGQVRWATFGNVDSKNAQPHQMECKTLFYGAHNGNITNCAQLKEWLVNNGHDVKSDNDGEMLVHMIEHYFAMELEAISKNKEANSKEARATALKKAIVTASKQIVGSYASIVVDPVSETMAGIKAGSSFYMGQGFDEQHGHYILASSDLASVLSQTKILFPIKENEFAIFDHQKIRFFNLGTGEEIAKDAFRSKLKVEETELKKPFKYFMEQEIFNQVESASKAINLFTGSYDVLHMLQKTPKSNLKVLEAVYSKIVDLSNTVEVSELKEQFNKLSRSAEISSLKAIFKDSKFDLNNYKYESSFSPLIEELSQLFKNEKPADLFSMIEAVLLYFEAKDISERIFEFSKAISNAYKNGKTAYFVACGTSFNAAKAASIFFNHFAGVNVSAWLPGDFRASVMNSVSGGDVIIGISQSGETKDLIDIFNQLEANNIKTVNITIVNNINSTLALEKCNLYLPLFCGPEIAVPATKSFINQMVVLYVLACNTAKSFKNLHIGNTHNFDENKAFANLKKVPELIAHTMEFSKNEIEEMANTLYLEPSMHILATGMYGIAREGALKVREVVLNHTEGFEAPEFKHGPNTILGVNTIFGLNEVRSLLKKFNDGILFVLGSEEGKKLSSLGLQRIYQACADYAFADIWPSNLDVNEQKLFKDVFANHNFFNSLYSNYPLLFITGPNERDVNLTISQINTHKIRGANIYIIAEENKNLRASLALAGSENGEVKYRTGYVVLPKTDDELLPFFTSIVVVQLLALSMSIKKMEFLNKLEISDHGVHPDAPKNVSKSITVD